MADGDTTTDLASLCLGPDVLVLLWVCPRGSVQEAVGDSKNIVTSNTQALSSVLWAFIILCIYLMVSHVVYACLKFLHS